MGERPDYLHVRRQRSFSNPLRFESRSRSGSRGSPDTAKGSLPSSWDGSAFGDMRINSMPNSPALSPDMRHSPLMLPQAARFPPAVKLPPALHRGGPVTRSLLIPENEKSDIKHNKRVMKQENIMYPSPDLKP